MIFLTRCPAHALQCIGHGPIFAEVEDSSLVVVEDLDLDLDHIRGLHLEPRPAPLPDLEIVLQRPPPGHPSAPSNSLWAAAAPPAASLSRATAPSNSQWAPASLPSAGQWADTWGARSRMRTIGSIELGVDNLTSATKAPEEDGGDSSAVDGAVEQQPQGVEPIQGRIRRPLQRVSSTLRRRCVIANMMNASRPRTSHYLCTGS